MIAPARDGSERLLRFATTGLPANRVAWGAALRAELASIESGAERTRFARSAAVSMSGHTVWARLAAAAAVGGIVAIVTAIASRAQPLDTATGILGVTVALPAALLLAVAAVFTATSRSMATGLRVGMVALVASFLAVLGVTAVVGLERFPLGGVFLLDGEPVPDSLPAADAALNLVASGMWIGHVILWGVATVVGTLIGGALGAFARLERSPRPIAG